MSMVTIKMRTLSAGPNGVREAGSEHTVSREEAMDLIRAGAATVVRGDFETAARRPDETRHTEPPAVSPPPKVEPPTEKELADAEKPAAKPKPDAEKPAAEKKSGSKK